MSTKELKLILKEAKEHIKNKEYKATIKKCNVSRTTGCRQYDK